MIRILLCLSIISLYRTSNLTFNPYSRQLRGYGIISKSTNLCIFGTGCSSNVDCELGTVCKQFSGYSQCLEDPAFVSKTNCKKLSYAGDWGCFTSTDCCNPYATCYSSSRLCILSNQCSYTLVKSPMPTTIPTLAPALGLSVKLCEYATGCLSNADCIEGMECIIHPYWSQCLELSQYTKKKNCHLSNSDWGCGGGSDTYGCCNPSASCTSNHLCLFQQPCTQYRGSITISTYKPTTSPTQSPSLRPTVSPSVTIATSKSPTPIPSSVSSTGPSRIPTLNPSPNPSQVPTIFRSCVPVSNPTVQPSLNPTPASTSSLPTANPSQDPTFLLTACPSAAPSLVPTPLPSKLPTNFPNPYPTTCPTAFPSSTPTVNVLTTKNSLVTCPFYSTSNTYSDTQNFVDCAFTICNAYVNVTIPCSSVCTEAASPTFNDDTILALVDENGNRIAYNDDGADPSCYYCSSIYTVLDARIGCNTFTLQQGCYGLENCYAQYNISIEVLPDPPTPSPTESPTSFPTVLSTVGFSTGNVQTVTCPYYSAVNTLFDTENFVNCSFTLCNVDGLINIPCSDVCKAAVNPNFDDDTYYRLYNEHGVEIAYNDDGTDPGCYFCSAISTSLNVTNGCETFTLRQGCFQDEFCYAQSTISVTLVN